MKMDGIYLSSFGYFGNEYLYVAIAALYFNMKIFTVMFDVDKCKTWSRLLDVFRESIHEHMPEVELIEKIIEQPPLNSNRAQNLQYNTVKLKKWIEHMDTATDNTIFMDCDMLCLQHAGHVWSDPDFDVAVTFRPVGSLPPMNGGVVFARPTDKAREFFRRWLDINNHMYDNPPFHHKWCAKYLGMNQAAFGYMYESGMCESIKILPTRIWNAVDDDWKQVDERTVFVHVKSQLRRAVMQNAEPYGAYKKVMNEWYRFEERLPPCEFPETVTPPSTMNPRKRLNKKIDHRKPKQRRRVAGE